MNADDGLVIAWGVGFFGRGWTRMDADNGIAIAKGVGFFGTRMNADNGIAIAKGVGFFGTRMNAEIFCTGAIMDRRGLLFNQLTDQIIGCAFRVGNTLGVGFLEKVYENALAYELRKAGLQVETQYPIKVYYDGVIVGDFLADLLVENSVLVELKAVKTIGERENAQCLNYLKASKLSLCLLINFGTPKIEIKRIINT